MKAFAIENLLDGQPVIAAVQNPRTFKQALQGKACGCILLKFGDLQTMESNIQIAHSFGKHVMVYLDSLNGIARDGSGVAYLASLGVEAAATTKPQLLGTIERAGLLAVQSMFVIDSTALSLGIESLQKHHVQLAIVMPGCVPVEVFSQIRAQTQAQLLAGGLVRTERDLRNALAKGAKGIITGSQELW